MHKHAAQKEKIKFDKKNPRRKEKDRKERTKEYEGISKEKKSRIKTRQAQKKPYALQGCTHDRMLAVPKTSNPFDFNRKEKEDKSR